MIKEIPPARESIVLLGPVTILEVAQMGFGSMSVHAMSFPLMTKKTGSGGELNRRTSKGLAAIGL